MTLTLHRCEVHGIAESVAMDGGIYCVADDPKRPAGVCGRATEGAEIDPETGKPYEIQGESFAVHLEPPGSRPRVPGRGRGIELKGPPASPAKEVARMKKSPNPKRPAPVRAAGVAQCEKCGRDMAGEFSRAKRCTPCREAPASSPRARPQTDTARNPDPGAPAADRPVLAVVGAGAEEPSKHGEPTVPEPSADRSAASTAPRAKELEPGPGMPLMERVRALEDRLEAIANGDLRSALDEMRREHLELGRRLDRFEREVFGRRVG